MPWDFGFLRYPLTPPKNNGTQHGNSQTEIIEREASMMRKTIWALLAAGWAMTVGCSDEDSTKDVVPEADAGPQDAGADTGTAAGGDTGSGTTQPDAGGADTGTGGDIVGDCMGMICREPPDNICAGSLELSVYNTYGWCAHGECFYADHVEECLTGPCASGLCTAGPCQGVRCDRPPASVCVDGTSVRRYNNIGYCKAESGSPVCEYASEVVACDAGCADGRCVGEDPCAHVVCDAPPARYCAENGDLMVWDTVSRCENGTCLYSMQRVTCALGCVDGHCEGDLTCKNTRCDSPPASFCLDGSMLQAFDSTGACEDGACLYASKLIPCTNGCRGGQCVGEPCAGVVCDFRPVPHCASDTSLTYWDGIQGTCAEGVCHYGVVTESCPGGCGQGQCTGAPCIGVHCDSPPVSYCVENTFRSFVPDGVCQEGICSYTPLQNSCPAGCEGGVCSTGGDTGTDTSDDTDTGTDGEGLTNVLIIGDAGEGGGVITGDGTTLTIEDNSLPAGSTVTVNDAGYDVVETAGQVFNVVAGFDLVVAGTAAIPPVISTPNEDGLPQNTQILVVEKMDLDDGVALSMVGTASVSTDGARIESNNASDGNRFLGKFGASHTGVYLLIVTAGDQGFTSGRVTDGTGSGVAGLRVHSSSNIFISVTDVNGYYVIPDGFGSRSLFVLNPATGEHGSGFSAVGASDQVADIRLREPPVIADAGLPNGCLDVPIVDGNPGTSGYTLVGDTQIVVGLAPIAPLQGGGMALMTTGEGAEAGRTSGLDITFTVPAGVALVNFNYLYLSDELFASESAASPDLFSVFVYAAGGGLLVFEDRTDDAEMIASDTVYAGEKGWRGVSVNVAGYAGLNVPVTLSLVVGDVADSTLDTAVLVDNLRFDDELCDGEQTSGK